MASKLLIDFSRALGSRTIRATAELDLAEDCVTVLFGPSGSGKTTILRAIAGLDSPDEGRIQFDETIWFDRAAGVDLPPQARTIGYLSQSYDLFPHMTVRENVRYGAPDDSAVDELLGQFRIAELADRRPGALSGGEKQRAALARAIARRPRVLLLDEPLSALDTPTRELLRSELRAVLRRAALPAIVVTHDRTEALTLGDRMAVVVDGEIAQVGAVEAIFNHPVSLAVARATGIETVVPVDVARADGEIVFVRHGDREMEATRVRDAEIASSAFALIRAQDVTIETERLEGISARNQLTGTISSFALEDPLVRLRIDCGFELTALITRRSFEELSLAAGSTVIATFKASAVRLLPRG